MNRWESTSVKISYDDFSTICRICLGRDNLKCLQEVEYLIDLLRLLTNAEVCDNDNLPQNICDNCIQKLEEISDFLDLTKFNDSLLRQINTTREPLTTNTISWASKSIPNGNKTVPNYTKEKICTSPEPTTVAPIIENNSDDKKVLCEEAVMLKTENNEDRSTESDSSFNRDSGQDKFREHFSMKDLLAQRQLQLIRRREGNRRAAAKRRQKLQESTMSLAKELENLENVNSKLKNDKKKLLNEKDSLLKLLSRFKCTNKHLKILEKKANKKIST